ncbi:MAG: extracellular solute-binding protein [Gammaproteobacteria bacterium]|nr:extracellular solute-binding protein [Gammaproteobacteria bacterium]
MVIAPRLDAGLISGPILDQAERFGEQTGASIRVVTPGWNETAEKIHASLDSPTAHYDVYVVTTSWLGSLFAADAVAELPPRVMEQIDWQDVLPIYRDNLLTWNSRPYALPYDGDTVTLYYRRDLLEDPGHRAAFEARFGYPLRAPATWREVHEIADFFTGWDWSGDGEPDYGLVGNRKVDGSAMLIFLSRAAAYARHPDDPAFYFDPLDMTPRIDNPGFVRALAEYVEALDHGPPGMSNFAGNDVRAHFIAGCCALAVDWANIGIMAESAEASRVRGRVGYAPLPGADEVWNSAEGSWEQRPNRVASMVGNYLFLVSRHSRDPELAFAFAAHMTSREMTARLVVTPSTGINPSRLSHLDDSPAWEGIGFSHEAAERYLGMIRSALASQSVIFDVRIPGSARYYASLDQAIMRALRGEQSPQEALSQAAQEWQVLTNELGRESQIRLHAASLNQR